LTLLQRQLPADVQLARGDGQDATDLYPDVAVPKTAGRWISSVQYQMARAGQHRSASAVDLIIAATAAHHGLTVLHDDSDYRTVARHSSDLAEQNIHDLVS
jgi:predicted nucleic acid-binding protein